MPIIFLDGDLNELVGYKSRIRVVFFCFFFGGVCVCVYFLSELFSFVEHFHVQGRLVFPKPVFREIIEAVDTNL